MCSFVGRLVKLRADGRRFEIRWLPGSPSGENYEIIREFTAYAAESRAPTVVHTILEPLITISNSRAAPHATIALC
jgi:hypothetical protein